MNDARADHRTAELLERAYRMALLLQGANATGAPAHAFERMAVAAELVALLDEARVALLLQAKPCSDSR